MTKIVITRTGGGVSVMQLVYTGMDGNTNIRDGLDPKGDEAKQVAGEIEKYQAIHNDYISHRQMPDDAVPTDRTYRMAWADTTPELVIDIDMTKAKEIQRDLIRVERKPALEAKDVEYMKAMELGDTKKLQDLAVEKQVLRAIYNGYYGFPRQPFRRK